MQRICRDYASERGCRKQDKCKFLHTNTDNVTKGNQGKYTYKESYDKPTNSHYQNNDNPETSFISKTYMLKIISKTDTEIIDEMSKITNLDKKLERTEFKEETFILMIQIIAKIAKLNSTPCKMILNSIMISPFFEKLKTFLQNSAFLLKIVEMNQNTEIDKIINFFYDLVIVCEEYIYKFISNIPSLPIDEFAKLIERINKFPNIASNYSAVLRLVKKLSDTKETIELNKIKENIQKENEKKMKKQETYDNMPITYKDENLFLTKNEIYNYNNKEIQKHRPKGDYESWDRYLNTMFYLVREDCYRYLRQSIYSISNKMEISKDIDRIYDVYYYKSVKVADLEIDMKGVVFTLNFEVLQKRISFSKRLLFGSLLIITKNDFEDLLIATVIEGPDDKKDKKFKKNPTVQSNNNSYKCKVSLIDNNFINFSKFIEWSENQDTLHMFESKAYYESYRHILKRIQDIDTRNFPFTDVIINFRKPQTSFLYPANCNSNSIIEYNKKRFYTYSDNWPTELESKMDASQLKALKHGLRNKVAIIQGPPGTGKTYVGSILTGLLLANTVNPILVVCYTNHALDQFLTKISSIEKKIVRIGGRCKEEALEQFMLSNIKKNGSNRDSSYYHLRKQIKIKAERLKKFTESFSHTTFLDYEVCEYNFPDFVHRLIADFNYCMKNNGYGKIFTTNTNYPYSYPVKYSLIYTAWINPKKIIEVAEAIKFENKKDYFKFLSKFDKIQLNNNDKFIFEAVKNDITNNNNNNNDDDANPNDQSYDEEENMLENMERREYENKDDEFEDVDYNEMQKGIQNLLLEDNDNDYIEGFKIKDVEALINSKTNLWVLPVNIRRAIMLYIKRKYVIINLSSYQPDIEEFNYLIKQKKEMEDLQDLRYLKGCKIVGMTTTGCAKYSTFLEQINFETVIVEEAAEVLESHISSILTKNTQRLILIGDHKQLKPNPYNYEICKKYFFDVSLFERLINNEVPHVSLQYQRRMRPEFADFVRLIYGNSYTDHENTKNKPNIKGLNSNIYFLNHKEYEANDSGLGSKSNLYEAQYIAGLAKYIILQSYTPDKITIITMYMAQVLKIREELKKIGMKDIIKITAVDNYQGEENDFILLSLVRSNKENQIGFLKTFNRVCVGFSRAILGFYVFGNFDCIVAGQKYDKKNDKKDDNDERKQNLWTEICDLAKKNNIFKDTFELKCQKHGNITIIKKPENFKELPEGGCKQICNQRLECGHVCELYCHNFEHEVKHCRKPCARTKQCGHKCPRKCYEECGKCFIQVKKVLPCGHSDSYPCESDIKTIYCKEKLKIMLPCGHYGSKECSSKSEQFICYEQVNVTLECGHKQLAECHKPIEEVICKAPCNTLLECRHTCKGTCSECLNGTLHVPCSNVCKKILICSHECLKECDQSCLCEKKCENICDHGFCSLGCCEECISCNEQCTVMCKHEKCSKLCNQLCNFKCNKPCDKIMTCNHFCMGLCGEECPEVCRTCNEDNEAFEIFFGTEEEPGAMFYKIDCGHIFELKGLDKHMGYNSGDIQVKARTCLKCFRPIVKGNRYKNIIKLNFNLIQKIKTNLLKQYGNYNDIFAKTKQMISVAESDLTLSNYKHFTVQKLFENTSKLDKKQHIAELVSAYNLCCFAKEMFFIEKFIMIDAKNKVYEGKLKKKFEESFNQVKKYFLKIKCYSKTFIENLKAKINTLWLTSNIINIEGYHKFLPRIMYTKILLTKIELDSLYKIIPRLTQSEMMEIMNISGGQWYSCPNGHLYSVGDCGRPMQESACPECRALIGGQNHNPHSNNTAFTGFNN